eukprot:3231924-Pleurochrysis_carterae.AAC.1
MLNVAFVTAALVLGLQRVLFDPGAHGAGLMHAISTFSAVTMTLGCALAAALTFAPFCVAQRAQANSARRKPVRGASATGDRRTLSHALERLTPLKAARCDALRRSVHFALRFQLISASCCVTLACIYCYMIHGSALLGINERNMPALATRPSVVDVKPVIALTRSSADVLTHVVILAARAAVDADDAIDAAFYKALRLASSRCQ